jgi:hypothetical protein
VDLLVERPLRSGRPYWRPSIAAIPGAQAVVYAVIGALGADAATIEALSLRDGTRRTLVRGGTAPRYLSSGDLVYVNQGTLFAVKFDQGALAVRGLPVPVLDDASYSASFGYAQFDVSQTGVAVYRRAPGSGQTTINWVDAAGRATSLVGKPARYPWPRISPDASKVAFAEFRGGSADVWVYDRSTVHVVRQTPGNGSYTAPLWSPDGQFLFMSFAGDMVWMPSAGGPISPVLAHHGPLPAQVSNFLEISIGPMVAFSIE